MADEPQPLEYASPGTARKYSWHPGRIAALIVAVILLLVLLYLWLLEFALEPPPPGNGYVLTNDTRYMVGIVMAILAVLWVTAVAYLAKHKFRLRRWQ